MSAASITWGLVMRSRVDGTERTISATVIPDGPPERRIYTASTESPRRRADGPTPELACQRLAADLIFGRDYFSPPVEELARLIPPSAEASAMGTAS